MHTPHPSSDQLIAFGRGRLGGAEAAAVEDHLAGCATCAEALATSPDDDLVRLVRSCAPAADATGHVVYRGLTFHARGGLGEVARGWDDGLGREVAVKRLLPGAAADPRCRQRFEREAAVTARLEHPGVVPVYARTTDATGRDGYVMRFVRGRTLRDAARAYHAGAPDPVAFRGLLGRFTAVCAAVAYAHSRGVVHRDVKPANVLLGDFGETLLLDWGLAAESAECGMRNPEPVPARSPIPHSALTQEGTVLGTPGYMAPEQARGEAVGPPADVYSLGATLHTLLTDAAPGGAGQPAPPPLLAVARKAMADDPAARYESPLALAADVDRWLADLPPTAHPDGFADRLRRWGRRNRTLVRIAAGGLVVVAAVSTAAAVLLARANERERTAAGLAEARKREAEANDAKARRAVDEFYVKVSEGKLKGVAGAQPFRRELLESALAFYRGFAADRADDPTVRADLAATYTKIAVIVGEVESAAGAVGWHERAVAAWRALAAEAPDRAEYRGELAGALDLYGFHLARVNRPADAIAAGDEAVRLLDPLAADDLAVASRLSRALVNLAAAQGQAGRFDDAVRTGRRGLALDEEFVRRHPEQYVLRRNIASRWANLGCDFGDQGRTDEAVAALERAVRLNEELIAERAAWDAVGDPRGGRAIAAYNLGLYLAHDERYAAGRRWLLVAAEQARELAAENPAVRHYRQVVTAAGAYAADAGLRLREPAEPLLREAERACDAGEKLVADDGSNPDYRGGLAFAHAVRGAALARLRRSAAATEAWAAADRHLPAAGGANVSMRQNRAAALTVRAVGRLDLGDAAGAAADADAALAVELPFSAPRLVVAARVYAGCAAAGVERRRYEDRALAALRAAVRGGYRAGASLEADPAFAPLRARPEWRAAVAGK